jgi:hypothetical protein
VESVCGDHFCDLRLVALPTSFGTPIAGWMENEKFQDFRFLELDDADLLFLSGAQISRGETTRWTLCDHIQSLFLSGYFSHALDHVKAPLSFHGKK